MFRFRLVSVQPVMGATVQLTVEILNLPALEREIELSKSTGGIFRTVADARLQADDAEYVDCTTCENDITGHLACLDCGSEFSEHIPKEKTNGN